MRSLRFIRPDVPLKRASRTWEPGLDRARLIIGFCVWVSVSAVLLDSGDGRNLLISFRRKERSEVVGWRADCRMCDVLVVQAS